MRCFPFLAIVILLFCNLSVFSQVNYRADSLEAVLSAGDIKEDSTEVWILYELAYINKSNDPDKAHQLVDRAIEKAKQINHQPSLNQAYRVKGVIYSVQGLYSQSFEYLYKAVKYAQSVNNAYLLASSYLSIGDILLRNRSYHMAEKYIKYALDYYQQTNDIYNSGYAMRMMANIAYRQGKYGVALNNFNHSLNYYKKLNYHLGYHGAYNDIGLCYKNLGEYEMALIYYDSAAQSAKKNNQKFLGVVHGNMGEVFMLQKKYELAITYLLDDIEANKNEPGETNSLLNSYRQLAFCYYKLNQLNFANQFIDSAMVLTKEKYSINESYKLEAFKTKADILFASGKVIEANNILKDAIDISQAIQVKNENVDAIESQINSEILNKEQELSVVKSELNSEQRITNIYLVFSIILVLAIVIYFFQYRKLRSTLSALKVQHELSGKQKEELDTKSNQLFDNNEQLKQANNRLKEMNEEKNEFIRLVAHDLKNPLSRIMGLAHLIEMEPNEKVEAEKEKLDYIKQSVEEMNSLIERFLDVNRIESGQQKIQFISTSIPNLIKEECDHFSIQAKEKAIDILLQQHNPIPEINSDPQVLKLIFSNLLSNAIKFSPHHQPVVVVIDKNQHHITVSVKDNGPGLNESDKQKIFKKYTRLSARPTGNESSSGLGLYLVKQMSEKIGIKITYESEIGKGTEMIMHVPLG